MLIGKITVTWLIDVDDHNYNKTTIYHDYQHIAVSL